MRLGFSRSYTPSVRTQRWERISRTELGKSFELLTRDLPLEDQEPDQITNDARRAHRLFPKTPLGHSRIALLFCLIRPSPLRSQEPVMFVCA